jgi:hypothetical protein
MGAYPQCHAPILLSSTVFKARSRWNSAAIGHQALNFGNFWARRERETMSDSRSNEEMLGEVLREIGVLVVVFFPFDEWIELHTLKWGFVLGSVSLSAACIICGMWLERKRRR